MFTAHFFLTKLLFFLIQQQPCYLFMVQYQTVFFFTTAQAVGKARSVGFYWNIPIGGVIILSERFTALSLLAKDKSACQIIGLAFMN